MSLEMKHTVAGICAGICAGIYAETCAGCGARERCPGLRREYLERFGERGIQLI